MKINRLFAVVAIGFLSASTFVASAFAQNAAQGSFTLTHEIRWQNATLPAGDYTFQLKSASRGNAMTVTGPNGTVFQLASVIERKADGPSILKLERRGEAYFVSEMDLPQVGIQLGYVVPKAPKGEQELAQGPATEQILVALNK
jgi:hypothetical protein